MRRQLLSRPAASADVHLGRHWQSWRTSTAFVSHASTHHRIGALSEARRAFHHATPICLKLSDVGNSPSLRSNMSGAGDASHDDTSLLAGGTASSAGAATATASRASSPRKSRKRTAAAPTASDASAAAASTGPVTPKKRGRRPASGTPSATTPAATPRATRKTNAKATTSTQAFPSASPASAAAAAVEAPATLASPPTGSRQTPLKTPGKTHCITKKPRAPAAARNGNPREVSVSSSPSTAHTETAKAVLPNATRSTTEASAARATPLASSSTSASLAGVAPSPAAPVHPAAAAVPRTFVTPFMYYSNSVVAETSTLSEEAVVAERASVTKLFMVSDSVASIFCALPHEDDASITNYLDDVDRATPHPPQRLSSTRPAAEHAQTTTATSATASAAASHGDDGAEEVATLRVLQERDVKSRVLVEERANHTLCIHVRDMEQLVPPAHLLADSTPSPTPATATPTPDPTVGLDAAAKTTKGRKGKGNGRRKGKATTQADSDPTTHDPLIATATVATTADAAVVTPSLSPLERLLALRQWQRMALDKARLSQARWVVPENFHAITRVRFHDPHKADLTLVQGAGGSKSVEDVVEAMARQLGGGALSHSHNPSSMHAAVDEEMHGTEENALFDTTEPYHDHHAAAAANGNPTDILGGAVSMTTPYALKPLLTVYASSIPRREPLFGIRTDQRQFLSRIAAEDAERDEAEEQQNIEVDSGRSDHRSTVTDATTSAAARDASRPARQRAYGMNASTQVSAFTPNPLTEDEAYAALQRYVRVAPMPRFLTRITLLVEHSELDPVDLLSIAEVTTARRGGAVSGDSGGAVTPHSESASSSTSTLATDGQSASTAVGASSPSSSSSGVHDAKGAALAHFVPPTPRIHCLIIDGGEM